MYTNITETMFIEEFRTMNRMDNFSIDGLKALYKHLTDLEEDTGQPIECDVIAICCDFHEVDLDFAIEEYDIPIEYGVDIDDDDIRQQALEWLQDETTIIPVNDEKVIIQAF